MHMFKIKNLDENGFAPIIVSIIIVTVLSLLTIGFVTLANNNTKNALNLQLSNDAYYAAESGVNDAIAAITHGFTSPKTTCPPIPGNQYLDNSQVNGPQDFYSCLLIDPTPASLQYSSVVSTQPTIALLSTIDSSGNPVAPADFIFSWEPSAQVETPPYSFAPSSFFPTCHSGALANNNGACLPMISDWIQRGKPITGILRIALTPIGNGNNVPTDTSTTYTAFLYPLKGNGSINTAPAYSPSTVGASSGLEVSGNCSNVSSQPDVCTVEVPLGGLTKSGFIMSMSSLYTSSQVTVEAINNNGNQLLFRNAQTLIDSTGNDHGTQRRIQVRVSTLNYNGFSAYDIASSNSICADLSAYPPNLSTGNPGGAFSSCGL